MKITFEQQEVLDFITKMLSTQGMKPTQPLVFRRQKSGVTEIEAVCEPTDLPDKCPVCGRGHVASTTAVTAAPVSGHAVNMTTMPAAVEEPPVSLMAGESLEPPFTSAPVPAEDNDGGGMSSIVAQSRALEAQRTRELESRRFNKKRDK